VTLSTFRRTSAVARSPSNSATVYARTASGAVCERQCMLRSDGGLAHMRCRGVYTGVLRTYLFFWLFQAGW
jgi:hypothetical protein